MMCACQLGNNSKTNRRFANCSSIGIFIIHSNTCRVVYITTMLVKITTSVHTLHTHICYFVVCWLITSIYLQRTSQRLRFVTDNIMLIVVISCVIKLRVLPLQFCNSFIKHAVQMSKQGVKMHVTVIRNTLAVLHPSLILIIHIIARRTLHI